MCKDLSERALAIDFGKYRTYDELYVVMKSLADTHPHLMRLYSIGKSLRGRDLWTAEITNHATGSADEKPGMWIDGNTHSPEVAGSAVCLKTIWCLLSNYGKDPLTTDLLDTRSIYVLPRLNPDGAEIWLTQPYHRPGAGVPNPEFENGEGHYEEDVDGDGHIVQMRIEDPNGNWKISRKDPRLMLRRSHQDRDEDGPFYRVMTEGMLLKHRPGKEIKMAPRRFLGGTNRNYPAHWAPGGLPLGGAGPFPLWEREARAIADFWAEHPNLGIIHTLHTSGGVMLRESITKPDSWFVEAGLEADLMAYKAMAKVGEELTGYPAISAFEEFTFEDDRPFRRGCGMSFFYEHLGAFVFSIELWDWYSLVGIGNFRERGGVRFNWDNLTEDQQLKALEWIDREANGKGFIDWKAFKHPQLGSIEIGGIDDKYTKKNPPEGKWLNYEMDKTIMFAVKHAALLPLLRIAKTTVTKLADRIYKIEAQVENTGFLPTNVTQMAAKIGVAKPVIIELSLEENAELVSGYDRTELGHLDGRSAKLLLPRVVGGEVEDKTKRQAEWVVRLKNSEQSEATIIARCPRAGVDRKVVSLS